MTLNEIDWPRLSAQMCPDRPWRMGFQHIVRISEDTLWFLGLRSPLWNDDLKQMLPMYAGIPGSCSLHAAHSYSSFRD